MPITVYTAFEYIYIIHRLLTGYGPITILFHHILAKKSNKKILSSNEQDFFDS